MATLLALSACVAHALAQTLTLPRPTWTEENGIYDRTALTAAASVITADAHAVAMQLACPTTGRLASLQCGGVWAEHTIAYDPSTYREYMAEDGYTQTQVCEIRSAEGKMMCTEEGWGGGGVPASTVSEYGIGSVVVEVTRGWDEVERFAAVGTGTVTGGSSASRQTALAVATGLVKGVSGEAEGGATGTASASASANGPSETGAASRNGVARGVFAAGVGLLAGLVM